MDGQLDVGIIMGVWPKPTVQDVEYGRHGIRLISFEESELDAFLERHPQWAKTSIPAGSYRNQTDEITAVSSYALISCRSDLDEEMVYKLTRVIWEHWDEAAASNVDIKAWMHKEDILHMLDTAPLHPGALRYYREIGLIP